MIASLEIISDILKDLPVYYDLNIKEKMHLVDILVRIDKLRKEIENEKSI